MHLSKALLLATIVTGIDAFGLPQLSDASIPSFSSVFSKFRNRRDGSCPAVWTSVASDLTAMFVDSQQCNDDARAAIRLAFHDCITWDQSQGSTGGCDGSIVLAAGEVERADNNGLQDIAGKMAALQQKYASDGVGVADLVQFAGSVAIASCPGGPQVRTLIGRKDSDVIAPDQLPDVHGSADSLLAFFEARGFNAFDLAALVGAHSTAKQFFVDPSESGEPLDSTPGIWDVTFYSDTLNPPDGVFVLPSDTKLANSDTVGPAFKGFIHNQQKWTGSFANAMARMALLGVPNVGSMVDCTSAVPANVRGRSRP